MVIWSILTTIFIYSLFNKRYFLEKKLKDLSATILNYQIKYENIYDKAYTREVEEVKIPQDDQKQKKSIPKYIAFKQGIQDPSIGINNLKCYIKNKNISFHFKIYNLEYNTRKSGHVFIILKYVNLEDKTIYKLSHKDMFLDSSGDIQNLSKGQPFNISNFKSSKININLSDFDKIKDISAKIIIVNKKGDFENIIDINLDLENKNCKY